MVKLNVQRVVIKCKLVNIDYNRLYAAEWLFEVEKCSTARRIVAQTRVSNLNMVR